MNSPQISRPPTAPSVHSRSINRSFQTPKTISGATTSINLDDNDDEDEEIRLNGMRNKSKKSIHL